MTNQQQQALQVLRDAQRPLTPTELAQRIETTANGAAATASSLVRKGLVQRVVGARVRYEATPPSVAGERW